MKSSLVFKKAELCSMPLRSSGFIEGVYLERRTVLKTNIYAIETPCGPVVLLGNPKIDAQMDGALINSFVRIFFDLELE